MCLLNINQTDTGWSMRTDAIQRWLVSSIIHLNIVCTVCTTSLLCVLSSTAFAIELDPTRNPPELSTIKELGSQFKQVIKQTHTQYADDGRIVVWDETYIQPLEASVLKYNFTTLATNHLDPAGSLAIIQGEICFLKLAVSGYPIIHLASMHGKTWMRTWRP